MEPEVCPPSRLRDGDRVERERERDLPTWLKTGSRTHQRGARAPIVRAAPLRHRSLQGPLAERRGRLALLLRARL
jgi:hypothetical protein